LGQATPISKTVKLKPKIWRISMVKNKFLRPSLFVVLVLAACFAGPAARAATVAVGTCKPTVHQYPTIGAAVAAVPAGTTVDVCPGTYPEQVLINKELTLIGIVFGANDSAVVVPPSGGLVSNGSDIFGNPVAAQIFVQSTNVTVSHLTVDGTGNNIAGCSAPTLEGIYFQNSSGKITDNVVRNQFQTDFTDYGGCQNGLAINVESLTSSNAVTVSDNSVRSYQKNGITATGASTGPGSAGPAVTITANYIVGLAATAMNWPGGAAENGIQIGFGATGTVSLNTVNDNIWWNDTSGDPGDAASGILIYASEGITVSGNSVGSAQFGIVADTDPSYGPADGATITSNKVSGTQIFDAIDVCSSSNTVKSNTIYGSAESGIHLDDSCGSGNNNSVTANTINEACAGILLGTGSNPTISPNTFLNVTNTTLAGDVCTPAAGVKAGGVSQKRPSLRPSPYKP
jgi:parallel beta-helix repeat protein